MKRGIRRLAVVGLLGLAFLIPVEFARTERAELSDYQIVTSPPLVLDTTRLGTTYWDGGYGLQLHRLIYDEGNGRIHLAWNEWLSVEFNGPQLIKYNSISDGILEHGIEGCPVLLDLGGALYSSMAMLGDKPMFVRRVIDNDGQLTAFFPTDSCAWSNLEVSPSANYRPSGFVIQYDGVDTIYHITAALYDNALDTFAFDYFRGTDLDSLQLQRFVLAEIGPLRPYIVPSPVSGKLAILFAPVSGEICYYESSDYGQTWGEGDAFGFRNCIGAFAQIHTIAAAYDFNEELHIIFIEDLGLPAGKLRHWSPTSGFTTITQALWTGGLTPAGTHNFANLDLAIGTGSRLNNLYLVWNQYGSAASDADTSVHGELNADIYLSISTDGGQEWDVPRNLTNSPSPACSANCLSESMVWITQYVDSVMHMMYLEDQHPGYNFFWRPPIFPVNTNNPIFYASMPTPDQGPVPTVIMTGLPIGLELRWVAPDQSDSIVFAITNEGIDDLTYTFTDTVSWAYFAGGPDVDTGTIAPGDTHQIHITIDPSGLPGTRYQGHVFLTSNDPNVNGFTIPLELNIAPNILRAFYFGTASGTDCWGWEAPDGTEYALMGINAGLAVVDATNLRIVDTIPGPGPCGFSWRDMETYRNYAYVVSECTGVNQGLQIIDLSFLPDSVHFVGAYQAPEGVTSHNLTIDTATGYAYIVSPGQTGVRIVDINDPENPVDVHSITTECHDLFARNDTLWVAGGNEGVLTCWDVSNKTNPQLIATIAVPNAGFVHNVAFNADHSLLVSTEETHDKTVKLWDISDLNQITLQGQYLAPNNYAHNAYIRDDYLFIAHYDAGVRIVDISTPASPIEVAALDTDPDDQGGCWGVYPYAKSGRIYASNINGVLFILEYPGLIDVCACDCHGDPLCDSITDVFDVLGAVGVAFQNGSPLDDPLSLCPYQTTDVTCDNVTDVFDVLGLVAVAFQNADPTAEFCDPCGP